MGFLHKPLFLFLSLVVVTSHAKLSPEDYWKSVLPNTPIPKAINSILPPAEWLKERSPSVNLAALAKDIHVSSCGVQGNFAKATTEEDLKFHDPRETLFFLENDLIQGKIMYYNFTRGGYGAIFLPQQLAQSIPFSSKKYPEILREFLIKPNSPRAKIIKDTIKTCEEPGVKEEKKYCATSLESMINFVISKFGKNVEALSGEVDKENQLKYSITKVTKVGKSDQYIACHKLSYPYAVFNCHKLPSTPVYVVSLNSASGKKAKALALCHKDTATWNPKHISFQILKVKPGTLPICHFLAENAVIWVPK